MPAKLPRRPQGRSCRPATLLARLTSNWHVSLKQTETPLCWAPNKDISICADSVPAVRRPPAKCASQSEGSRHWICTCATHMPLWACTICFVACACRPKRFPGTCKTTSTIKKATRCKSKFQRKCRPALLNYCGVRHRATPLGEGSATPGVAVGVGEAGRGAAQKGVPDAIAGAMAWLRAWAGSPHLGDGPKRPCLAVGS